MKVEFDAKKLGKVLKILSPIIPKRATMPVLQDVLLKAEEGGTVTLSATDAEAYVRIRLSEDVVRCEKPGSVLLNAKILARAVQDGTGECRISVGNEKATVVCAGMRYRLNTASPEDFPLEPNVTADKGIEIDAKALSSALARGLPCVSEDQYRNEIIYLEPVEGTAMSRVVATDGYRLALVEIPDLALEGPVFLSRRIASTIVSLFEAEESVRVAVSDSILVIESDTKTLKCPMNNDCSVNYSPLIGNDYPNCIGFEAGKTMSIVNKLSSIVTSKHIPCVVQLSETAMSLSVHGDVVDADQAVEIEWHKINGHDSNQKFGFNLQYLGDMVGATFAGASNITIEWANRDLPFCVRSEDVPNVLGIIMPMSIPESVESEG